MGVNSHYSWALVKILTLISSSKPSIRELWFIMEDSVFELPISVWSKCDHKVLYWMIDMRSFENFTGIRYEIFRGEIKGPKLFDWTTWKFILKVEHFSSSIVVLMTPRFMRAKTKNKFEQEKQIYELNIKMNKATQNCLFISFFYVLFLILFL